MNGNATPTSGFPADNSEFGAVVLGAGISGLVTASILSQQGYKNVLVVDEYPHVGGNHIDRTIGPYTFDIGSLVFQDDSPLLSHFPEILPHYVEIWPSWAKLTPNKKITNYPLSFKEDILSCGPAGLMRIFASLIFARIFKRTIGNARDFARYWMGEYFLQSSGLESYMSRFFGVDASKVDLEFAEKRMLWIKKNSSIKAFMSSLLKVPSKEPKNRQLARPRSGFKDLYAIATDKLGKYGVAFHLGQEILKISKSGDIFSIYVKGRKFTTRRIISTVPINRALGLCSLETESGLTTVTLISLFYSYTGHRGFDQSILYNFTHDGAWKRLTMYSDFYGKENYREYFGLEVIASNVGHSCELADADFRSHVSKNKIFPGELKLEGSEIVAHAYPIYFKGTQNIYETALDRLNTFGIESFGRQGGFDYQPTARTSTLEAEKALNFPRPESNLL